MAKALLLVTLPLWTFIGFFQNPVQSFISENKTIKVNHVFIANGSPETFVTYKDETSFLKIDDLYNYNVNGITNGTVVFLAGYYSINDGGGGSFVWNSASLANDNKGTIIKPKSTTTGRWLRIYSGDLNVKWFGAIPNGSRVVTKAIQSALNIGGKVVIPHDENYGKYIIDDRLVIKSGTWLEVSPFDTIYEASGNNVVLLRNEHIDTTGITDHDIKVTGGIWDANWKGNPGTSTFSSYLQLRSDKKTPVRGAAGNLGFYGVKNLIIENLTVRNAVAFSIQIARAENFNISNIHFDRTENTISDGLHINGPVSDFTISNITGKTGDDFVALNAWDWLISSPTAGGVGGDIKKGIISILRPDTCKWSIVKGYVGTNAGIYDITINDIKGVSLHSGVTIISSIDQKNREHTTGTGNAGNIILNRIAASTVSPVLFDGILYGPIVTIGANVTNLTIKDAVIDSTYKPALNQPFLWQKAGTEIKNLEISRLIQSDSLEWNNMLDFNGKVGQLQLSHSSFMGSGRYSGERINTTIRLKAGSSCEFVSVTNSKFSGVAGILENSSSGPARASITNCYLENFYHALYLNGSTDVIISDNHFIKNNRAIVTVVEGISKVVTVSNMTDGTGVSLDKSGGAIRWIGTDLPIDSKQLKQ